MRGMTLRYLALAAGIVSLVTVASPSVRADAIPVRAEKSGASSLITFAWRDPVSFDHEVVDGRVVVRFSRAVEAPLQAAIRPVGDLVSDVRQSDGGRTVSFGLTRPVEAYAFYTGTAVTVELVPTGDAPATASENVQPAPAPEPVAEPAPVPAGATKVGVRTGRHENYTRVVFDLPTSVAHTVQNQNGVVTMRFQDALDIDVSRLNGGNVRFVGGARSEVTGGETIVTMAVPASAEVRNFLSGPKVVVDVREQNAAAQPVTLPTTSAAASAPTARDTEAGPQVLGPARVPTPENISVPQQGVAQPAPTTPVEMAAIPAPASQATEAEAPAPAAAEEGRPRALTPNGAPPPAPAADADASPQPAAPAATPETPISDELSARASGDQEAVTARIAATPGQDQVSFRFDFDQPVAAAAFRRGGAVWFVFDVPMNVDTAAVQAQAGEAAFEILQIPTNNATVLRMRTSRRYNPSVARDGLAWIINLAPRDSAVVETPLPVNVQPNSPVGARVFIPVPEPGRPIPVADPRVGDNFVVVPLIPLGNAVGREFSFPQFGLQRAAQGVVINPIIDDLRVRALRQGVEITASGVRFAISPVSADQVANAKLAAQGPMTKALEDLADYAVPSETFRVARRRAEAAVADAEPRQRGALRMDLARFYFANGYAAETLGVLRVAKDAVPLLENDPAFRVMRGGSNFLMGRYEEALADLTHESVADNDEGRLWAAATTAMLGDRIGSARDLRFTGAIARDYPRDLKMKIGTLIAEVSAETGDGQGAKLFIDALHLEKPTPNENAMLQFAEAKLMELDGDVEAAVDLYEKVIASEHRPSRARARVALTEMLLKLQRINQRDAIESYEKLRFAWRGDKFEFNNLRRLGSLYLAEGYFRDGLLTLKEAATHFRDLPEATEVTKQMSDTFNALFLEKVADQIDPVKAIAIYNEFKELTPAGARGDEMIRNLADKLAEVDLLGQAANLLSAQVQFRLQGEQKARVGMRLALIHTLAQDYQKALDVLTGTEVPAMPEDLAAERRHLRARALFGLGRIQDALALIETDESENAELIRMEIYWDRGQWKEAAKSLRLLVRLSGADEGALLSEKQAARIFNYVVALTNSAGERAIAEVRREYGPAMANTTYAEAFKLVTAPPQIGVLNPMAVPGKVQEAETFLTAYRSKLKNGIPLSSIN